MNGINTSEQFEIYKENREAIKKIVMEFPRTEAEAIIALTFCGYSVDNAIQTVICG